MRSNVLRLLLVALLVASTSSILAARWWLQELPTQISAQSTYILLTINVIVVVLLTARPSALGLGTRTRKS